MPEFELRLRFNAANAVQADRLAVSWAETCTAEYGTRYAGWVRAEDEPRGPSTPGGVGDRGFLAETPDRPHPVIQSPSTASTIKDQSTSWCRIFAVGPVCAHLCGGCKRINKSREEQP
jgi:hypothetical protein